MRAKTNQAPDFLVKKFLINKKTDPRIEKISSRYLMLLKVSTSRRNPTPLSIASIKMVAKNGMITKYPNIFLSDI